MSDAPPPAALSVGSLGATPGNVSMGNLSLDFSGDHKLLSSSDFMKVTDDVAVRLAGIDDVKRSNELLSSDFAELRASHPEVFKDFLQSHRGDELDIYNFDDPEAAARLAAEEERRLEEERQRLIAEQERQKQEALAAELAKLAIIRRQQQEAEAQAAPVMNPFVPAYPAVPAPVAAPAASVVPPSAVAPPASNEPTPAQLIGMLTSLKMKQKEKLDEIRGVQKRLLAAPVQDIFNALLAQQNELRTRLEHELATLDRLLQGVLLSYLDVLRVFSLRNDLRVQKLQLELFFQELQLVNQNPRSPVAALALLDQPFPSIVIRQKPLDEPVIVQMLTAASVQVQSVSPMRAVITSSTAENFRVAMDSHANPVEPEVQAIDLEKKTARWHLKAINGSRKNFVYARFALQVLVNTGSPVSHTVILESPPSAPFVVITNEVQWEETEAALILHYAFQDQLDIPWLLLANVLQRHFVRGTRQNVMNPARPLSTNELMFIHRHFFGGGLMASRQQFTHFWAWFGKGVQRLRTTRPLGSMWGAGLLWCFISTQDAVNLIENESPGTFIVRLPEDNPGHFSIMYRSREPLAPGRNVGEVLVPPESLGPHHTLPELLVSQPQLELILQVTAMTQASTTTPMAAPYQFRRVPRTLAMSSFLATGRKARTSHAAEPGTPSTPAAAGHGRSFLRTSNASDLTFVAGGLAIHDEEVPPDA